MLVLAKKKEKRKKTKQKNRNYASTLYLASKWQNHFLYVHKETLWVLNSLSDKYKNSNKKQITRGRHPR